MKQTKEYKQFSNKEYKEHFKRLASEEERQMVRRIIDEIPAQSNENIYKIAKAFKHNHDVLAVINYEMYLRSFI
jgi:translation initiation factor RLI1